MLVYFKTNTKIYTNNDSDIFNYSRYCVETIRSLIGLSNKNILKIIIIEKDSSKEVLISIIDKADKNYHLSYYKDKGLELSVKEASKGLALEAVIDMLGINKDNVYIFGDEMNDLSMFKVASHRVATSNAISEIKQEATFVNIDCNESSIDYVLKHFGIIN